MHEKLLMGAEKERICKEEVVTYLEVQTDNCLERLKIE
jgi:hypothetical protein